LRIISLLNQKGGSGKTTSSVNLAAFLAEEKKNVLLIDLDPQASATKWCGLNSTSLDMFDLFSGNNFNTPIKINSSNKPNPIIKIINCNGYINGISFSLAPASIRMFNLEKILAAEVGAEFILKNALLSLPEDQFDFILIDCPANLGVLSVNAMVASHEVIIPVTAQYLACEGLLGVLQSMAIVRERLNDRLGPGRILVCQYDSRTRHSKGILEMVRKQYKTQVFKTVIRSNTKLAEASSFSMPINIYDNRSSGAQDYSALAKEVLNDQINKEGCGER